MPENSQLRTRIEELIKENPDFTTSQIAEIVQCTSRWVAMVKADIRQQQLDAKQQNNGIPVFTNKKVLAVSDIHAPYHVRKALDVFIQYGIKYDPHYVIINGDLLDCYAISFWRKDPRRMRFVAELAKALGVLDMFDQAFPGALKILISGNHEMRLPSYIRSAAPELSDLDCLTLPELLQLKERGWRYIDNIELLNDMQLPFNIGNLYFLHGHEVRVTMNSVNIPRNYFYKTLVPLCVGHHHTSQEFRPKRLDHTYASSYSLGCLCQLSADFQPVTNWNHGFATIDFDSEGDFAFRNRRIIGTRVD